VPRELCLFPTLRELDLDGGHLDGPIPEWLPECFPALEELDLSYNKVGRVTPDQRPQTSDLTNHNGRLNQSACTVDVAGVPARMSTPCCGRPEQAEAPGEGGREEGVGSRGIGIQQRCSGQPPPHVYSQRPSCPCNPH
jgi:hypothetical protein